MSGLLSKLDPWSLAGRRTREIGNMHNDSIECGWPLPNFDQSQRQRRERGRRILSVVMSFFLGQGALQSVNVLAGLFLVHVLSVDAYAQFGLAFGFQFTVSNLMDLGFASTVIPLVGDRLHDRFLVGRYVHAATRLRNRAFLLLAPIAVIAFIAMTRTHHWGWKLQILLIAPILIGLYSSGNVSCYSAPFFLYRRLAQFYAPQTLSGLVRLGSYIVLQLMGALNAWTAAMTFALNISYISRVLGKRSRQYIEWSDADTGLLEQEIVHYVLPAMPALIVGALQAQLSLFLISVFGKTAGIAQVAALSRIAQLFVVLQSFNMVVVEPYIARLSRDRLLSAYVRLILIASACCVPPVIFAFVFPQSILWVLGSKYEGLGSVVGWLVLASCINYLAGLAWVMNRARKWVYWSGTIVEIILLLVVQITFIVFVGVRTTSEAVMFSFVSSLCLVVAHAYNAVYGFIRGPRVHSPATKEGEVSPG